MSKDQKTAITPTRDQDYPEWYQQVIKAADMAEWHFLDPFDPEFHAEPQQLHQSQRHVPEPPARIETLVDPELIYAESRSLLMTS